MGIRVFIVGYVRNVKSHFFAKQGVLATHLQLGQVASSSRQIIDWQDCHFCSIMSQLSWLFNFLHALHEWHFDESSVASYLRVLVTRILLIAHTLDIFTLSHTLEFFTLSHTQPLHDSHLNTEYLISESQSNLTRNKTNIWLNKFNLTILEIYNWSL